MLPEKTIITSETPNSSSPLLNPSSSRTICHVCTKQFSQYTCPRCNFRYCSLPCYKSHNTQCTESFAQENVNEQLHQLRSDDETKTKMLEILKRFHSQDEEQEEEEEEDSILINKILSGDEVSFNDLSLEERKSFQRALVSGELSKMIKPWDPWWLKTITLGSNGNKLVQCVDEEDTMVSEVPKGPDTSLVSLSELGVKNPSPLLLFHLVDVVFSYCFTLRIYNGEWEADSLGSGSMVMSVSSVLGKSGEPESVKEVLAFCLEKACSSEYKSIGGGLKFGLCVVDDVIRLLSLGNGGLVCLLCDLQRLVQGAIREGKLVGRDLKKRLKLAERKVFFMTCWVNEQSSNVWGVLETAVRAEKNALVELHDCREFQVMKKKEDRGVVIEEIE